MGNRSRYAVAGAAAAAAVVAARRRARLRRAMEGIGEAILPTHVADVGTGSAGAVDEIHAPGHQHRAAPGRRRAGPRPRPGRPWGKHEQGMTHPVADR